MSLPIQALLDLVTAAMSADYPKVRRSGSELARHVELEDPESARQIRAALNKRGLPLQTSGYAEFLPVDAKSRLPLIEEVTWPTTPAFLNAAGQRIFSELLADAQNQKLLVAKGIASRLSLLMHGPPGTGKTLLAGHLAAQLGRKLYVVRLDSVISSLLGDTAKNIRGIFDFVAGKNAVLLLDELDALAKMRDDRHELGELKRVVNTVIQGIDALDESVVLVAATNHPKLLDPAIWRRFPYRMEIGLPDTDLRFALWSHFLSCIENESAIRVLADASKGLSGAEISELSLAARRKAVLKDQPIDYAELISNVIGISTESDASPLDVKRKLAVTLARDFKITQIEIGRILGVTRQTISTYLRDAIDEH